MLCDGVPVQGTPTKGLQYQHFQCSEKLPVDALYIENLYKRPCQGTWLEEAARLGRPLLFTTWVGGLHRRYLLIGDRNGRTAMPLFAYEIEFRSRRVAIQTGLFQRRIDHFVSAVLNGGAVRGDIQSEKLPAVRVWKGCAIMLYHCLGRDQLQNCAGGIFLIGHAVPEYPDSFHELFGIGILNPRVSHFRQVEDAAKAFFGYHKIISRKCYGQIETQNNWDDAAHYSSLSRLKTRSKVGGLGESSGKAVPSRRRIAYFCARFSGLTWPRLPARITE